MTGKTPKTAPLSHSAEMDLIDKSDRALNDAIGIVATAIEALDSDDEKQHLQRALIVARNSLEEARDLMDEMDEKCRKPRWISENAAADAAKAAQPVAPMTLAQIKALETMCANDRAKLKAQARAKKGGPR